MTTKKDPPLWKDAARYYTKIKYPVGHPDMPAGGRRSLSTGQDAAGRALVVAVEMQARVDRHLPAVEDKAQGPTAAALLSVRDLSERFLREYHRERIKDMARYRREMRYALGFLVWPYLGERPAAALRPTECRAWLTKLREEGYAPASMTRGIAALSVVFRWAIGEELLQGASPLTAIERPTYKPSEEHLALEEVRALRGLPIAGMSLDLRLAWTMAMVGVYAGLRRGELRGLCWEDVGGGLLEVRRSFDGPTKTGEARTVPIHAELAPLLTAWRTFCPTPTPAGLVFPAPRHEGRVITWRMARPQDVADELREVFTLADISRPLARPWHALRHSLATHLDVATGGDLDVVSLILGHTRPGSRVTRGYAHSKALPRMAAALALLSFLPPAPAGTSSLDAARARRSAAE